MKKVLLGIALFAIAFIFGSVAASAQTTEPTFNDKSDVYVGYQFNRKDPDVRNANYRFDDITDQHGVNTALTFYPNNGKVGFTGEIAANFGRDKNDNSTVTAMTGLTLKARESKVQPFARALIGVARERALNEQVNPKTFLNPSDVGLAFAIGGGLDVKVHDKFSLRLIQADYMQTRVFGQHTNNLRLGAGFVF